MHFALSFQMFQSPLAVVRLRAVHRLAMGIHVDAKPLLRRLFRRRRRLPAPLQPRRPLVMVQQIVRLPQLLRLRLRVQLLLLLPPVQAPGLPITLLRKGGTWSLLAAELEFSIIG